MCDAASPFSLANVKDKASLIVVLDAAVSALEPSIKLAFRSPLKDKSITVSAGSLVKFIEAQGLEVKTLDFTALAAAAPAAAPKEKKALVEKKVVEKKDDDEKEGPKIGIEAKKDEDLPTWYQQVGSGYFWSHILRQLTPFYLRFYGDPRCWITMTFLAATLFVRGPTRSGSRSKVRLKSKFSIAT